jgi:hypothetical protein
MLGALREKNDARVKEYRAEDPLGTSGAGVAQLYQLKFSKICVGVRASEARALPMLHACVHFGQGLESDEGC